MKYTAIYFKMNLLHQIKESLLHLAFPHICEGCGTDVLEMEHELCLKCLAALPHTNFHLHADNPIEKIFWGRLPVQNAAALFYFTKESLMQHLMHQLKYRGNKELGFYLGKLMGESIAASNRFKQIDGLVPLPLFKSKEKKRGYNQATVLCEGISKVLEKPVWKDVIHRTTYTDTQTKKNRIQRWQNMENRFELNEPGFVNGKHILLVDDVITTGATLESCGLELLKAENVQLSLLTLCFSVH